MANYLWKIRKTVFFKIQKETLWPMKSDRRNTKYSLHANIVFWLREDNVSVETLKKTSLKDNISS